VSVNCQRIAGGLDVITAALFEFFGGGIMRVKTIIAVSILLLSSVEVLSAPDGQPLPGGRAETVLALRPLIDLPEGIAIDPRGHIFVSNRRLENDARVPEILEVALDGTVTVFATLGSAVADDIAAGVLGLGIDSRGDIYAALASSNPTTHGVWRIRRGGEMVRLPGSNAIVLPNSIAFDDRGNVYVTDSTDGAIWRFPRTAPARLWIRHALLAPDPNFGIGANGITFVPPRDLFVANTDLGLIVRVRIGQDGKPVEPEVVASGIELLTIDGLTADAHGQLHAVIAAAPAFGTSSLVQVNPDNGEINPSTARADAFDFPTSLAFGRGPRDHKSLYLVNSGLYPEGRPQAAPGVIQVGIRVPGSPVSADLQRSPMVRDKCASLLAWMCMK
jgi:sugar lactone lactonase YvrE